MNVDVWSDQSTKRHGPRHDAKLDAMKTAMIPRTNVDSESLASVGYDDDQQILEAVFNRGEVYRFFLVPRHVFDELLKADSKGGYFNRLIRGRYMYARL